MDTQLDQPADGTVGEVADRVREDAIVLIVEDDPELADLYEAFIERAYTVRKAYSGDAALSELDHLVDIVLLDRQLGKWSGDELLTVIRDREIECQVAMVTGVIPDFEIADLPIDDYLTKPVSKQELIESVEELLLRQRCTIDQRELLALISRRIALEEEKSDPELQANDHYAKLEQRIRIAEDRLDVDPHDIGTGKFGPSECQNCGLRWDIRIGEVIGFLQLSSQVWKCANCGHVDNRPMRGDHNISR